MKTVLTQTTLVLSIVILFVSTSYAETICLRSRIVKGKISNASATVADGQKCPKKYKPLFSSTSLTTVGTNVVGATGAQGPKGDTGAQGVQGIQGIKGAQGLPGVSGADEIIVAESQAITPNSNSPKYVAVSCPSGYSLLGGYGSVDNNSFSPVDGVAIGYQSAALNTFAVQAFEAVATSSNWAVHAYAYCRPSN